MREAIYAALSPVRSRQQMVFAVRWALIGLIAGAFAALAIGLARQLLGAHVSPMLGLGAMAGGTILGLLVGLIFRRGWHDVMQGMPEL